MDLMTFISKAIEDLAWPAVVVMVLCLFRSPLTDLINTIKDAKFKLSKGEMILEGELSTVREKIEKVQEKQLPEQIKQLASSSPKQAIEESWRDLQAAAVKSVAATPATAPLKIADMLIDKNILTEPEAEAFFKLFEINEQIARPQSRYVTAPGSASDYSSLALTLSDKISKARSH